MWVFLHFNYPNLYTMCGISFILYPSHCPFLCSFIVHFIHSGSYLSCFVGEIKLASTLLSYVLVLRYDVTNWVTENWLCMVLAENWSIYSLPFFFWFLGHFSGIPFLKFFNLSYYFRYPIAPLKLLLVLVWYLFKSLENPKSAIFDV